MDKNLNLASGADLQRSVNQLGDILALANVGLDDDGLGAVGFNLLGNLLSALFAAG